MTGYAAIVLAGGAGRRLGGPAKPALPVAGRPMLERVLAAVADAAPCIVVGPPALATPPAVLRTIEQPPGGGPVAATAAGLDLLTSDAAWVALLAADLPLLTSAAVAALHSRAEAASADGACYLDFSGRRQILCGVWRVAALRSAVIALAATRDTLAGAAMRALLAPLDVAEHTWESEDPPPWFDCDTDTQLRQAQRWAG